MIALVHVGKTGWSIAELDEEANLTWWCGESNEWVSPHSSHWAAFADCWNETFPTQAKATAFAKKKGWL